MKLTAIMRKERTNLDYRFRYTPDTGWIDKWRVHRHSDPVEGDCEDYALTLLWKLCGGSWLRFWWLQLTFQAVIWHVTSYNGNGHAALWYKGWWADNMEHHWYKTQNMRHARRFPWIAPLAAVKLLISKFV